MADPPGGRPRPFAHPGTIQIALTGTASYRDKPLQARIKYYYAFRRERNYSDWFGRFQVPRITSPDKAAADAYEERYIFFAYVLLALIVIHLAALARHRVVRRDRVAAPMIDGAPGLSARFRTPPVCGLEPLQIWCLFCLFT
jgi:hypothetical protein